MASIEPVHPTSNDNRPEVVLVNPHHRFGREIFRSQRYVVPLSLLAVATPLDAAGYRVTIIDQKTRPRWQQLLRAALLRRPICVGVTCKTGPQIAFALDASRVVKEHSTTPVVWGGVHPSLLPEQTLAHDLVDIVVRGEGEDTFLDLTRALEQRSSLGNVQGISYKEGNAIRTNPPRPFIDLNAQPPLAYHLVNVHEHIENKLGEPLLRTFTSRGCANRCAFCYNLCFNQGTWRGLAAGETVRRLRHWAQTYGVRGFVFSDDNFFGDLDRAREILEGFARADPPMVLTKIDIRADLLCALDDSFLRLLQQAGCSVLNIGAESGSERILRFTKKGITTSQLLALNRRVRRFGLIPKYSFIMGFPTETHEELEQTVALILRLIRDNPALMKSLNIFTAMPGTELFDVAVEHGLRAPERLEDWIPFNYRTVNLPWVSKERSQLLQMLHCCSNFLEERTFFDPTIDIHPMFRWLARLYRPLARWRVEKLEGRFPAEIRLLEKLGLYQKQS